MFERAYGQMAGFVFLLNIPLPSFEGLGCWYPAPADGGWSMVARLLACHWLRWQSNGVGAIACDWSAAKGCFIKAETR